MDVTAFDRLAWTLATAGSRRAVPRALMAGACTAIGPPERAAAQPSRGVNGDELHLNGGRCHTGRECRSGRCERRHDAKKVRKQAGTQGLCIVEDEGCAGSTLSCSTASDSGECFCFVTTKGRSLCVNSGIQPAEPTDLS